MVNFLLKVVLCADDPSGPIMETSHHSSLHVGRMMGLEVEIPVYMCGKQSNVVYHIPCSYGQVYIGETKRRLESRLKEHRDACERGMMEKSAVAEHAWEHHHPIHWEETTVLDHGRGQELLVKEALHIQMTPMEERFNRDGGLEVPGCWTVVMRRQGGGAILTDL